MKIEKINDNQIRCTLTRADLESRDIKLSELAYGNVKARSLFAEMMKQAYSKFGLDWSGEPVMVEAIPMSKDELILNITHVESPEELDTRFARFSQYDKVLGSAMPAGSGAKTTHSARDVVEQFKKALDELENSEKDGTAPLPDFSRIYQFGSMEELYRVAAVLTEGNQLDSTLYLDKMNRTFFLKIDKGAATPELFNQLNNQLAEYGDAVPRIRLDSGYIDEHCKVLFKENALSSLKQLA